MCCICSTAALEMCGTTCNLKSLPALRECTETWLLDVFSFTSWFSIPDLMGLTRQVVLKSSFCWLWWYLNIYPYGITSCLLLTSPALASWTPLMVVTHGRAVGAAMRLQGKSLLGPCGCPTPIPSLQTKYSNKSNLLSHWQNIASHLVDLACGIAVSEQLCDCSEEIRN